jgi:hypothetical protein
MSDENGVPSLEEQSRPDYVAPLELGAQQANYDHPAANTAPDGQLVREEANPVPGPDSVTGPAKETKEFVVAGPLHPDEYMTGEGSGTYDGDGLGLGPAPEKGNASSSDKAGDTSSPERKTRAADKLA